MITFEEFAKEIKTIAKDCEEVTIGPLTGFKHFKKTGMHEFLKVDLYIQELGIIHVAVRDYFDDELMLALVKEFDKNRTKKYKKDELRVYAAKGLKEFDCYGVAPPLLARTYPSESTLLNKHGYQIFPMYGIEFLDHYSGEQFWTQRRRKDRWNVNILRWDRRIDVS